ncbi:MAG: heme ABC exporter ATP-binding protein CcmA [Pseudomonadota bacterium]
MGPYQTSWNVRARDLGCDRGGRAIVRGVSFTLESGDALQLFGANGAGKSTLLNVFGGVATPAEGALHWQAGPAASWDARTPQRQVLFLADAPSVKAQLTAHEHLRFWAAAYGLPNGDRESAISAALERVGIEKLKDTRAERFSAGQRRRLDFARALLARRPIWLLDEPTAALDAQSAEVIGVAITDHLSAGGVAIIATHATLNAPSKRLAIG